MSKDQHENTVPDLSHHLSREAKERLPNHMKTFLRSIQDAPNVISLANGDPHPSLYALAQVDYHIPALESLDSMTDWITRACPTEKISAFNGGGKSTIDLSVAMQYNTGLGLLKLREQLGELNSLLHGPKLSTRNIAISLGNADAVTKIYRLLGTPGDTFLVDEYSFCGLTNAPIAQGVRWQPIKIDSGGLIPQDMEEILSTWDEAVRGSRPHVLYCIPTGQNPTGATIPLERRREIYAIAQKYDIIILEDDPYYFFHYADISHEPTAGIKPSPEAISEFVKELTPTFLSLDVDGRVIRVDTLSKTLAPNMRLGWITCNELFCRKLEILTDNSTQHASGLSQSLFAEILGPAGWGMNGYLRWVWTLRIEYQRRRDLFYKVFQREIGAHGHASTQLPEAGMFFWVKVHFDTHPRYIVAHPAPQTGPRTNTTQLMDELFKSSLKGGVLIMPGILFAMQPTDTLVAEHASSVDHILDRPYVRATFVGTDETIETGLSLFGKVLEDFFKAG